MKVGIVNAVTGALEHVCANATEAGKHKLTGKELVDLPATYRNETHDWDPVLRKATRNSAKDEPTLAMLLGEWKAMKARVGALEAKVGVS